MRQNTQTPVTVGKCNRQLRMECSGAICIQVGVRRWKGVAGNNECAILFCTNEHLTVNFYIQSNASGSTEHSSESEKEKHSTKYFCN